MVVVGDDLDFAPVDAAVGVDLLRRDLGRLGDRGARDRLVLGDHADPDRAVVGPSRRRGDKRCDRGDTHNPAMTEMHPSSSRELLRRCGDLDRFHRRRQGAAPVPGGDSPRNSRRAAAFQALPAPNFAAIAVRSPDGPLRRRAPLPILAPSSPPIEEAFIPAMMRQYELVERVRRYNPHADEDLLNRAYVFAMKAHGAQNAPPATPISRIRSKSPPS